MSRIHRDNPELFIEDPGDPMLYEGEWVEQQEARADAMRDAEAERAAQASTPSEEDEGSTPSPSICAGCGQPMIGDGRWCSRSCYATENDDPEGAYE